jgi:hypothetical protein
MDRFRNGNRRGYRWQGLVDVRTDFWVAAASGFITGGGGVAIADRIKIAQQMIFKYLCYSL